MQVIPQKNTMIVMLKIETKVYSTTLAFSTLGSTNYTSDSSTVGTTVNP